MSDSKDNDDRKARADAQQDQHESDVIIDSLEANENIFPAFTSMKDEIENDFIDDNFVIEDPADSKNPISGTRDASSMLRNFMESNAANDTDDQVTEKELIADYFNVDHIKSRMDAVEIIQDASYEQLVDQLRNCDTSVVSILSDGTNEITAFQLPPVDSEHYEALSEIANLNSTGRGDGGMQQSQLDSNSMLLIDGTGRAAILAKDARFHFSNPFGRDNQAPEDPAQGHEEGSEHEEEPDSLLEHFQAHLASLTELRREQLKNPDKSGGGGGGGFPSILGLGNKNQLESQIKKVNKDIEDRLRANSLNEAVQQATGEKSVRSRLDSLLPGPVPKAKALNSRDMANVARIAKNPMLQRDLMVKITDKATEIRSSLDELNANKSHDPVTLKNMSNGIREKFYGAGGLAHYAKIMDLVNERNGFDKLGKLDNAKDLINKMKESLDGVRLHPLADKLSIDGGKLIKLPSLESMNKAIQDISAKVNRLFETLGATLTSIGGRER